MTIKNQTLPLMNQQSFYEDQVERAHDRRPSNPLEIAYLALETSPSADFKPDYACLVLEKSDVGGCSLAVIEGQELDQGSVCRLRFQEDNSILAEVRWKKNLDLGLTILGVQFLD